MVGDRAFTVRGIMRSGDDRPHSAAIPPSWISTRLSGSSNGRRFDRIDLTLDEMSGRGRNAQRSNALGVRFECISLRRAAIKSTLAVYHLDEYFERVRVFIGCSCYNSFSIAVTQRRSRSAFCALGARQIRNLFLIRGAGGGLDRGLALGISAARDGQIPSPHARRHLASRRAGGIPTRLLAAPWRAR